MHRNLAALVVPQLSACEFGSREECADFFNLPYTGVINRPELQDILLDERLGSLAQKSIARLRCKAQKEDFITNGVSVVGYAPCRQVK